MAKAEEGRAEIRRIVNGKAEEVTDVRPIPPVLGKHCEMQVMYTFPAAGVAGYKIRAVVRPPYYLNYYLSGIAVDVESGVIYSKVWGIEHIFSHEAYLTPAVIHVVDKNFGRILPEVTERAPVIMELENTVDREIDFEVVLGLFIAGAPWAEEITKKREIYRPRGIL